MRSDLNFQTIAGLSFLVIHLTGCPKIGELAELRKYDLAPSPSPSLAALREVQFLNHREKAVVGKLDENGRLEKLAWASLGTDVFYECRTGGSLAASNAAAWSPCTPSSPDTPEFSIPNTIPDGSLTIQVRGRLRSNGYYTPPAVLSLYVHSSLNGAIRCPASSLSDEEIFANAATVLGINLSSPSFGSGTIIDHPEKTIELSGGASIQVQSLRRIFSMSSDRKMILVKRVIGSKTKNNSCENKFTIGSRGTDRGVDYHRASIDCPFYVLSANGRATCLGATGNSIRLSTNAKANFAVSFTDKSIED